MFIAALVQTTQDLQQALCCTRKAAGTPTWDLLKSLAKKHVAVHNDVRKAVVRACSRLDSNKRHCLDLQQEAQRALKHFQKRIQQNKEGACQRNRHSVFGFVQQLEKESQAIDQHLMISCRLQRKIMQAARAYPSKATTFFKDVQQIKHTVKEPGPVLEDAVLTTLSEEDCTAKLASLEDIAKCKEMKFSLEMVNTAAQKVIQEEEDLQRKANACLNVLRQLEEDAALMFKLVAHLPELQQADVTFHLLSMPTCRKSQV